MRYTTFGRTTGLRVSEYALGTANFGTRWGSGAERAQARRIFDKFAEAGGTFLDSADSYQHGQSEELLGEFLGAERDNFVLATKYTNGADAKPGVLANGNSRRTMVRAVEASLRRLNTDYIDLYWAHFPDTVTPVDEIVAAFDDLVRAGKILHGGLSNFPAWRVARAATLAELRDRARIVGVQVEYSLADRTAERDVLPMAEAFGLGVVLWSPLAGGLLTGKYRDSDEGRLTTLRRVIHTEDTTQKTAVVDALLEASAELAVPASQLAIAWMRQHAATASTPMLPIIGPRTEDQLDDYLAALTVTLPDAVMDRLTEVSAPSLGTPHDQSGRVRGTLLAGDTVRGPAVPAL